MVTLNYIGNLRPTWATQDHIKRNKQQQQKKIHKVALLWSSTVQDPGDTLTNMNIVRQTLAIIKSFFVCLLETGFCYVAQVLPYLTSVRLQACVIIPSLFIIYCYYYSSFGWSHEPHGALAPSYTPKLHFVAVFVWFLFLIQALKKPNLALNRLLIQGWPWTPASKCGHGSPESPHLTLVTVFEY